MSPSPASAPAAKAAVHYPQLDGLRGIAILLVVVGHVVLVDFRRRLVVAGELGVTLFFVLSGFLITDVLCRELSRSGTVDAGRFYLRRVLRIFPAYYLFLAVVLALRASGALTGVPPRAVLWSAVYLSNFSDVMPMALAHTWSLSLEEQFYLLWPWLFRALPARRKLALTLAAALAVVAARELASALGLTGGSALGARPWFRFDAPLAGCCLALWLAMGEVSAGPRRWLLRLHPLWTGPLLVVLPLVGRRVPWLLSVEDWLRVPLCASAVLWLQLAPAGDRLLALVSNRALRWVGRISYSLYLWQQLFLMVKLPEWGPIRRFPVDVVAAFALAALSHRFVETPFLRLKARLQGGA